MFNTIIIILEAEAITLHTLVINVLNIIQVTFIFAPVSFGFVSNPMYIPNPSVHRVCMLAGWLLHLAVLCQKFRGLFTSDMKFSYTG